MMNEPNRQSDLSSFVAIDFETADTGADSACALGIVRVQRETIVSRWHRLIRPPRRRFRFTYLHGISWKDVEDQPTFGELWPEVEPLLQGVAFIAAHNAHFDQNVLLTCCRHAGVNPPAVPFRCTVQLARKIWNLRPARLPDVCRHLGLPLKHHDAASDAEACAQIVIAAVRHFLDRPTPGSNHPR